VVATREVVVAVWAGAFDGSGTKGALAMWSAAPIARAALLAVRDTRGRPLSLPEPPAGIAEASVCRVTGQLPGPSCPTKREHFHADNLPSARCSGHHAEKARNRAEAL
jgi:hypothetical protein